MGDTAGDVGPGRFALGRQQFGNIVESDDKAADVAAIVFGRDAHEQGAGVGPADELNLRLGQAIRAPFRFAKQSSHFRRHLGEVLPDRLLEIDPEKRRGGAIRQVYPS